MSAGAAAGGSPAVRYALEAGVARVTLDRPERRNALGTRLVHELRAAVLRAREEGARAILLHGEGRSFCAGHDLKEPPPQDPVALRDLIGALQDTSRMLRHGPPAVAAVQGHAVGGGFELALACDLVVCEPDATLLLPEVEIGEAVGNGVSKVLVQTLGTQRAAALLLLSERIDGRRAYELGLVARLAPAAELLATAEGIARLLAGRSPDSVRHAKEGLRRAAEATWEELYALEIEAMMDTTDSPAARESAARFRARGGGTDD